MLPGPPIYKQCPYCAKYIAESTILSGNTFGAVLWSDGKFDAPMMPSTPSLVACPFCQALVWLNELPEIDEHTVDRETAMQLHHAQHYEDPTLDQYMHFLDTNALDVNKERYVRIQIWWMNNDVRRTANPIWQLRADEQTNLERLASLFDATDMNQQIMKAEAMRQLSRFEEADTLLASIHEREYASVVERLRSLVHDRNPALVRLTNGR